MTASLSVGVIDVSTMPPRIEFIFSLRLAEEHDPLHPFPDEADEVFEITTLVPAAEQQDDGARKTLERA